MDKNNVTFNDLKLNIPDVKLSSNLAKIVVELEQTRVKILGGTMPSMVFFQLKEIFQFMESLGSARIEGNRTTLSQLVEKIIEQKIEGSGDEKLKEILNLDKAISFIHEHIDVDTKITRSHLSEIHKIIVEGLTLPPKGEGSCHPGDFRSHSVSIQNRDLVLPDPLQIPDYFSELLDFINTPVDPQHDLLVTALSHHRMAWIHPFDNGNGRMVRMLTYILLIKKDFKIKQGRIINPTAIFCIDRDKYYDMLAKADTGEEGGVVAWCEYVLGGLQKEIEKIDKLTNVSYVISNIFIPALNSSLERKHITDREYKILKDTIQSEGMTLKSADLENLIGPESNRQRSRILKKLRDQKMLIPIKENSRTYTISFNNNYLLRSVVNQLEKEGFIPDSLNRN